MEELLARQLLVAALVVIHYFDGSHAGRLDSHAEGSVLRLVVFCLTDVVADECFAGGIYHFVDIDGGYLALIVSVV
ncbi:MAG: hypothetical protein U0L19_06060 [Bacteroidales bacterium]|nr:hypothetical protein [Bacteroidales bacterium]